MRIVLVLAAASLAACATTDYSTATDALLTESNETVRMELVKVTSEALSGRPVSIAPDALTTTNRLIIEEGDMMGRDGNPLSGRLMNKPDHFVLKKSGAQCVLYHEQGETYYPLENVTCSTLSGPPKTTCHIKRPGQNAIIPGISKAPKNRPRTACMCFLTLPFRI